MPHTEPNDILTRVGRNSGMTVPDGYFKDFNQRMAAMLPEQEWEKPQPKVLPRSRWQKVRPYVYLAAMFMGIWCMMKMFNMMRPTSTLDIASSPELMSAIDNDSYYYDYCVPDVNDNEIYDDLFDEGFDPNTIVNEADDDLPIE